MAERPEVYVHDEFESDDPVRTFYEVPDYIATEVRTAAAIHGESFASCLRNLVLEREGALGEVTRLAALLKERNREAQRPRRRETRT
jgi:hypothetical protein